MNSEKLIMDKERQNKTDRREGGCKLFYQYYYDLLIVVKVVVNSGKSGLKNIITTYCQIREVFKSVLIIQQHAESKDDRK